MSLSETPAPKGEARGEPGTEVPGHARTHRISPLAGVYWEWSKKKRKFVILCGVTGTILYYPRPPQ
jgi:hypothetical protein